MQVLIQSLLHMPANRRMLMRRVPAGVEVDAIDYSASVGEEFLSSLAQRVPAQERNLVIGFDEYSDHAREFIEETCGIEDVQAKICNSNFDLLQIICGTSLVCAGAASWRNNYSKSAEALSHALITSGTLKTIQGAFQTEIGKVLHFLPTHGQLIRSTSGRPRIIDHSTAKQAVIARTRGFAGNVERIPTEILKRQDRADVCSLATFGVYDAAESSNSEKQQINVECLRDDNTVLGFSAVERICSEFARFIVQIEKAEQLTGPMDIIIQVNSYSVACLFARKLQNEFVGSNHRTMHSPDVLIGWAGELTMMRSLFSEKPTAIVCVQRFPFIELLYFHRSK